MDANVLNSLVLAGKGMLGIFVVMVLIALVVLLLSRLTSPKQNDKET
jgi:hypothetical protein